MTIFVNYFVALPAVLFPEPALQSLWRFSPTRQHSHISVFPFLFLLNQIPQRAYTIHVHVHQPKWYKMVRTVAEFLLSDPAPNLSTSIRKSARTNPAVALKLLSCKGVTETAVRSCIRPSFACRDCACTTTMKSDRAPRLWCYFALSRRWEIFVINMKDPMGWLSPWAD